MFETMSGFLWFFFVGLGLITLGIACEEKLVAFEKTLLRAIRKVWKERRRAHESS